MASVTICSDFGAPQNKVCHCFLCFPIYLPWSDGTRCHDLATSRLSETRLENCRACLHPYLISSLHQPWVFIGRTDAEAEAPTQQPTHLKRPWCWERLKAGGEGDDRRQDGWMTSPTQWIWVWANSGRWWRTGKPGVLQSVGSQRDMIERLNNNNHHLWTVAIRLLIKSFQAGDT